MCRRGKLRWLRLLRYQMPIVAPTAGKVRRDSIAAKHESVPCYIYGQPGAAAAAYEPTITEHAGTDGSWHKKQQRRSYLLPRSYLIHRLHVLDWLRHVYSSIDCDLGLADLSRVV